MLIHPDTEEITHVDRKDTNKKSNKNKKNRRNDTNCRKTQDRNRKEKRKIKNQQYHDRKVREEGLKVVEKKHDHTNSQHSYNLD